jgi:hypothetical protein
MLCVGGGCAPISNSSMIDPTIAAIGATNDQSLRTAGSSTSPNGVYSLITMWSVDQQPGSTRAPVPLPPALVRAQMLTV